MNETYDNWITQETIDRLIEVLLSPPIQKPTDNRGHAESIGFRVTPNVAREISIVAQSPNTPYQTSSDLLRDCINIGLNIIRLRGDVPLSQRVLIESRSEYENAKHFCEELGRMVAGIIYAYRAGMKHLARKTAADCYTVISSLKAETKEDVISAIQSIYPGMPVEKLFQNGRVDDELLEELVEAESTAITRRLESGHYDERQ